MHVFKNVSGSFWKHITSTKKDTQASIRYLVVSKMKEILREKRMMNVDVQKHYPIVPWILSMDDIDIVKKVIHIIRAPTICYSSLAESFIVDGWLTSLKTHDYHNLLKVCITNVVVL
jgi:hypothetical protein